MSCLSATLNARSHPWEPCAMCQNVLDSKHEAPVRPLVECGSHGLHMMCTPKLHCSMHCGKTYFYWYKPSLQNYKINKHAMQINYLADTHTIISIGAKRSSKLIVTGLSNSLCYIRQNTLLHQKLNSVGRYISIWFNKYCYNIAV